MALESGTKLGSYAIVAPLGAGGMGEVYRATDCRLDRKVAIKVLPESMSRDAERVARFQREAKVLASLNHPNIAAIYGFEEVGNSNFLIMELVEGGTLADGLARGSLTVDDALSVARQIAEALEAAHEKGVIHRDLKPANVKITEDGKVKVLDFGLAKAMAGTDEEPQTDNFNSPTITAEFTRPGVILGTAAYMSPEQARGRPLDKRTDIWSFGAMFYELLTGHRLFAGETTSDAIGAILHKEPDWNTLPPNTPPTMNLLLRRCLAKDRNQRLRDIGDARIEIETAIADPTSSLLGLSQDALSIGTSRTSHAQNKRLPWAVISIVVALIAGLLGWSMKTVPQPTLTKLMLGITNYEPTQGIAISPDGRKIVYSSNRRLWVRELDKLAPRELKDTDHASQPAWSPDSSRIAYGVENKLWHIHWQGGAPTAIGNLPTAILPVGGISWTKDDRLFVATGNTTLHVLSARGGDTEDLLPLSEKMEEDFHHAATLPDDKGVLFTIHKKGGGPDQIDLWSPNGRKTILHMPNERFDNPVYSPTGHIVYSRSTTTPGLWAIPFSLSRLEVSGEPFLIVSDAARPTISHDGTLAYIRGTTSIVQQLIRVDRSGEVIDTIGQPQPGLQNPRMSPDNKFVAVDAQEPDSRNIWIHDIERRTKLRLTFDDSVASNPVWIPGSNQIAFSSGNGQDGPAFMKNADGSGLATQLPVKFPTSCSRDGTILVYQSEGEKGDDDIGYYDIGGSGESKLLVSSDTQERYGTISPDGKLVAYVHREAGLEHVYLTTLPGGEGRWQISVKSGTTPRWNPNGNELFYIDVGSFSLMSVTIEREPTLRLGTPQRLFSGLKPGAAMYAGYDVSSDGQEFIMVQINDPHSDKRGIALVQNWFEEFKDNR